jgi:hypothetical protein
VTQTISSVIPRRRTVLRGEIVSVKNVEMPAPRTDVTISDGTGTLVLRFVGRRTVPGVESGRCLVVEGTPGWVHGELVMLSPLYSFDDAGSDSGIN